jgi:DNA-binding transcriptional ArsR family regulator
VSKHWKKDEFRENEKKLRDLIVAKPMSFKDLRPFFNSPTTLNVHLKKLVQKGIIRKNQRLYEIVEGERYHLRAEQISDHIGDFLTTLDENTFGSEARSKEPNLLVYALIDYLEGEFDEQEIYAKGGPFFVDKPHLKVSDMRVLPLKEVKECALSAAKIEVDADGNESVRLSFPRMKKGKKIMYFVCREG